MSSLSRIQHTIQQICTPLAFSINTLLIQLILHKSPKKLGVYKYLMIYIAVFEMMYSILDIISAPDFYSYDSMFLVITLSDKILVPKWSQEVLTTVFCTMFGVSMAMFGIHFVYRYLVVTGSRYLKTFSSGNFIIWFSLPILYGILWAIVIYITMNKNIHVDNLLITSYLIKRGLRLSDICYIGPIFWIPGPNGKDIMNTVTFIGMFFILVMVIISILTILIFATLCYKRMGTLIEESSNSKQYRNLQLQLLNSLVAQALIPAFLMQGPSCIVFSAPFFHKGTELLGGILGITVSLYPVLDPLPTMFVIKHYRNALLKCCLKSGSKPEKSTKSTGMIIRI